MDCGGPGGEGRGGGSTAIREVALSENFAYTATFLWTKILKYQPGAADVALVAGGCRRVYRVSQEVCARLRESVPYVKVYRYNPKHLYPKLNGYGDKGFLRFQILQPAQLMCHATGLMSLRLECSVSNACVTVSCLQGVARMPFVFSHVEYCDMHFVYGFCNGNAHAAAEEYQRRGVFPTEVFRLEVFSLVLTRHC